MIMIAFAALALVADTPDAATFPELSPDALAPAVIQDLKRTLPDPYSIRDLTICAPRQLKLRNGRPYSWYLDVGLNAKGPSGGYSGLAACVLGFKQGVVNLHAFTTMIAGVGGPIALSSNSAINRVVACQHIPDARVQALLEAPQNSTNH